MKKTKIEFPNNVVVEDYNINEVPKEEDKKVDNNEEKTINTTENITGQPVKLDVDNFINDGGNVDNSAPYVDKDTQNQNSVTEDFLKEMVEDLGLGDQEPLKQYANMKVDDNVNIEEDYNTNTKGMVNKENNVKAKKEKPIKVKKEKKPKDKEFKNTYMYGFIFIVFSFILEIVNCMQLGFGAFPANFGIELSILIIIAGIIFIVPSAPAKITLTSIFLGIQIVLNVANASLFKVCNDIITLDMVFTLGGETIDVFELNQIDIVSLIVSLVIIALYVLSIVFKDWYAPKFKIHKHKKAIFSLIFLLVSVEFIGVGSLNLFKIAYFNSASEQNIIDNNEYWYTSLNSKFTTFKKYGFWSFYINNAKTFFGYDTKLEKTEKDNLIQYINDGKNHLEEHSIYNGNNVSGSLAGENVVVIMMESMEWFAIDEFNTPELYKFINNEAISFNNYYSRNKTNISEQIALLGSVPNEYSLETIYNKVGIDVPNSLPNLFKDAGYESVKYFHNYLGKIYDRETIYNSENIGFDKVRTIEDYPNGYDKQYFGDFVSDSDYIGEFLPEFMPRNKKFFSFFTTMSGHGPYAKQDAKLKSNRVDFRKNYSKYQEYAREKGWQTPKIDIEEYYLLEEYKARAMELEKAFIKIMNYIETPGESIKDKTSIIMFADHNAYYSDMTSIVKGTNKYDKDKEQYNVPLVMYCSDEKFGAGEVDTFCNSYDLYPTICDLFGLEYNKSLTQGYSIFSNDIEKSVFVSYMSGMFDDKCFALTCDEIITKDNKLQTNSNIAKFKDKLNNFFKKQDLIDKYYKVNYEKNIVNE